MTMHYLWWVPCVILYYSFYGYLSKKSNDVGGAWMWWLFFLGAVCPFWVIVSRISKRLYFDGMLYDVLAFVSFNAALALLGAGLDLLCFSGLEQQL